MHSDAGLELSLVGAGGEPVDLRRTIDSHGFSELPPMLLDASVPSLTITLRVPRGRPRTVRIRPGRRGRAALDVLGRAPSSAVAASLRATVRHVLRLDADLSGFYEIAGSDPDLAWVARGAGRMLRSPTVFEDVVKTVCTTNCAWSATQRMVGAIVEHLGEPAAGAPAAGPEGRAFPTPQAMADAGERFYRTTARAGYRGAYLMELARSVVSGDVDLEWLGRAGSAELSDDELEERLLALPGVGPYAAAHIMMTIGRFSRLILDSWTRPTYARLTGKRSAPADATIVRHFNRYGPYAGLAFWMLCTRDWHED